MKLKKFKVALKKARTKFQADKTDKEAKAAWIAAKKALSDAKERAKAQADENGTISNGKKRSLPNVDEGSPKKKSDAKAQADENEIISNGKKRSLPDVEGSPKKKRRSNVDPVIKKLGMALGKAKKAWDASDNDEELKAKFIEAKTAFVKAKFLKNIEEKKKKLQKAMPPSKICWIGNLSNEVDEDAIKEFLKDCGKIESIRLVRYKDTRKLKGFGFLTFDSVESATKAVNKRGEKFMDREFKIDYDKPSNKEKIIKQAPPSLRLFIGNIPKEVDDDKLKEHFKNCGELADIHWVTHRFSGDFVGYGFCRFHDQESADKAYAMSGQEFCGRPMKVEYTHPLPKRQSDRPRPRSKKPDGCISVYVGGLPHNINTPKITEFFSDAGVISEVRWLNDRDSGEFKGCCFIQFEDPAAIDAAVAKNGSLLAGRTISVDYSRREPS